MNAFSEPIDDLVSVIIPCYNQGRFLGEAIESVLQQDWPFVEIIVVDDGSTDETRKVASNYAGIKYIYQENKGLSNARNKGIENSAGGFLIMLDSDDWLYPNAITTNISFLKNDPLLAFTSGAYAFIDVNSAHVSEVYIPVKENHYINFLKGNYIGSPAAVMYRRWVFNMYKFNDSIKVCEDYLLYLQVARDYRVKHHSNKISAYRRHESNMSSNFQIMLSVSIQILENERSKLRNKDEEVALKEGLVNWKRFYARAEIIQANINWNKFKNKKGARNQIYKSLNSYFDLYLLWDGLKLFMKTLLLK